MNILDLKKLKNTARKNKQPDVVSAIDYVLSEIDLIESRNNKTLNEDEVMTSIKKTISQLRETQNMYAEAARNEDAEVQKVRADYLQTLLPQQLSDDDAKQAVVDAMIAVGASSVKDMGKVMAHLKQQYGAALDMKVASNLVKTSFLI